MNRRSRAWPAVVGFLCVLWSPVLRADSVVLVNGDTLTGRVMSLDAKELKLESELLGSVAVPREKVATINLGKPVPRPAAAPLPASSLQTDTAKPAAAWSLDDLLKQLQTGGVDAGTMKGVQEKLPLLAVPEVQQYFTDKVSGLMSGKIGIQDIRKDAIKARDEIRDLKKDLGPQGAALDSYLSILEGFIRQTEPKESPPAKPSAPSDKK